jgi:hypothetical protein
VPAGARLGTLLLASCRGSFAASLLLLLALLASWALQQQGNTHGLGFIASEGFVHLLRLCSFSSVTVGTACDMGAA